MPKLKKYVDTPRTKLAKNLNQFHIMTPLKETTNLGTRATSLAVSDSSSSMSTLLESPEADRRYRHVLETETRSPMSPGDALFSPQKSHDLSIIKPFNLSGQTDDDLELSLLEEAQNKSFRPIVDENDDEKDLIFSLLSSSKVHTDSPKMSRKRKRRRSSNNTTANSSPLHHLLEKRPRPEDAIKRGRCKTIHDQSKPMPSFQSPTYDRERSASSLATSQKGKARLNRCFSVAVDSEVENLLLPDDSWGQKKLTVRQVADLVTGKSSCIDGDHVDHFHIIDARYEYEYNGGHIKGAISIPKVDDEVWQARLRRLFFEEGSERLSSGGDHTAVIFHCEFSVNRGPNMRKWFRELDRRLNEYPELNYRRIFVMEGGFKEYHLKVPEIGAFEPKRAFVSETDVKHKAMNDKILKQKRQAEKKRSKKRPKPYERDRTLRRPGLRDLNLSVTTVDTSTPVRRSKRNNT